MPAERQARQREACRRWYIKNSERIRERQRKYNAEHREQCLERQRKYNAEHREQLAEYMRKYHETHREQEREYRKKYHETHREQEREYRKRRYKKMKLAKKLGLLNPKKIAPVQPPIESRSAEIVPKKRYQNEVYDRSDRATRHEQLMARRGAFWDFVAETLA